MAEEFKMPPVEAGMAVLWYPGGTRNEKPFAALVSAVGDRSIAVNLIQSNTYNFVLRDGVRHVADPDIRPTERHESGAWDYTQTHKDYLVLKHKVEALEKKTAAKQ